MTATVDNYCFRWIFNIWRCTFFWRVHIGSAIIKWTSALSNFNTNVTVKFNDNIPNCFSSYSFQFYKVHEYFANFIVVIDISQADRYISLLTSSPGIEWTPASIVFSISLLRMSFFADDMNSILSYWSKIFHIFP